MAKIPTLASLGVGVVVLPAAAVMKKRHETERKYKK